MSQIEIRGAGIIGLSIAFELCRRGHDVRIVDPAGVAGGASGGIVGALSPHVPENWNEKKQFQFESLILARKFWRDVEAIGQQRSGYQNHGRIQPLANEAAVELAEKRAQEASDYWGSAAIWQLRETRPGWGAVSPSGVEIFDTLSAHIHPRQACLALWAALSACCVMLHAEPSNAAIVIDASGIAGLEALNKATGKTIGRAVKGQAALLDFNAAGAPQIFANALHIIPHADGTTAIGSTSELEFDEAESTDGALDELVERAKSAVPALKEARLLTGWAGLRPRARSRAPILDHWPGRDGHFIANGGFKIGFGMAPKIAEVMADLVLDGRDHIPASFKLAANL